MHSQKKHTTMTVSESICLVVFLSFIAAFVIVPIKVTGVLMASGCTVMPRVMEKPLCRIIDGVGACRVP